jgi:rfaE bifunctional protein kinase chain/domain
VDREPEPLHDTHPALLNIVSAAKEFLQASDALLVSDYGYGAATPRVLNFIRSKGAFRELPVTLDSRYRMLEFSGITAATPNEPEVEAALGVQLYSSGKQLLEKMKLQSLVITRGSDGMCAFERGEDPQLIPVHGSDQVTDVTGAGDTVIATFTAALAAGADTITAARIANFAGGIVVMKRGTATVSRRELTQVIEQSLGGASRQ